MALFGFGVLALAKSVKFQPWTKTGQEEEYKEFRRIIALPVANADSSQLPKVECPEPDFNFGIMPPFVDGTHVFEIKNSGSGPLVLKNSGTSCNCTDSDFTAKVLAPGDKQGIPVSWNTDKSGKFAQFLKVTTNSPETPELQLWVEGNVATILDASVGSFGFGDLLANEIRSQDFYLYSGLWDQIVVDRIETTSEDIRCEQIAPAPATEEMKRILSQPDNPALNKSRLDLRVTATAQASAGRRTELLRIFVRPPAIPTELKDKYENSGDIASAMSLKGMYKSLRADGTLLVELPIETVVLRRLSLYGPAIADGDKKLIDLGKLRTTSPAREWTIIGKVRGDQMPSDVNVALTGIDGVSATVEKIEGTTDRVGNSYRIKIRAEEKLQLGAHNGEHAGKLTIESPGIPGEELLEFNVELDVLEEN